MIRGSIWKDVWVKPVITALDTIFRRVIAMILGSAILVALIWVLTEWQYRRYAWDGLEGIGVGLVVAFILTRFY
jgi:glycerol uptake facilitator-like aquaporin